MSELEIQFRPGQLHWVVVSFIRDHKGVPMSKVPVAAFVRKENAEWFVSMQGANE